MYMFSQAVTAGGSWKMNIPGAHFRIIKATDPIDVKFYASGKEVAMAQGMDTGFYNKPAGGFDAFVITSATAQTVKVMVADADAGYDHFNVDITSALQNIAVTMSGNASVTVQQAVTLSDLAPVSVGVAATALLAANANRKGARFTNSGTVDVYLGGSGVTTANGAIKITPGATWIDNEAAPAAWYGISGTAGQSVRVQELV